MKEFIEINEAQFGPADGGCFHSLAKIVNERRSVELKRKVGKMLSSYRFLMKQFRSIPDKSTRQMLRRRFSSVYETNYSYWLIPDKDAQTHFRACIVAITNEEIRSDGTPLGKRRQKKMRRQGIDVDQWIARGGCREIGPPPDPLKRAARRAALDNGRSPGSPIGSRQQT